MTAPSVSPVATGHMLLFPRHHVTSLQKLTAAQKSRLVVLAAAVSSRLHVYSNDLLYFEHGADFGRACGVGHAHLHLVPLVAPSLRNILGRLSETFPDCERGSLPDLLSDNPRAAEYLIFGSSVEDMRIAFVDSLESQLIRGFICSEIGAADFDWKNVSNVDGFRTTLEDMSSIV